ncbi:MAG: hydroxymethylbilane synthase [Gemmatimonadetes bacterium]|nr:hydroxymethylbilane synthase [Gemmatimonadota bacterium]
MKIGTRGSELALIQARDVQARLAAAGFDAEIVTITTRGDRREIPRDPADIGKALWTREIEEALHEGSIDLAVHSLKDLPAELPEGLVVGAVLPREDPGDVLVSRGAPLSLVELPEGARVGTGSIRRAAALAKARPDLRVVELKGNVPTRLRRLDEGDFDAIVLAAAGLNRLGRNPTGLCAIDPAIMPPALCQGVVAVEVREGDVGTAWVTALDDPVTMTATRAERALLAELEVGCGAPVGGLAVVEGGGVMVYGEVLSPDGSRWVREVDQGPVAEAAAVGRAVGEALASGAAAPLLESLRS